MRSTMLTGYLRRGIALAAILAFVTITASATDGTQLIGIGALQKGTAGAGVASPKDMTWVLMNPASIVDIGCRIDLNLELFAPNRDLEPRGVFANPFAGDMNDDSFFLIPSMGICRSGIIPNVAVGIGLYGTSGMGVDYRQSRSIIPKLTFQNYDRRTGYSVAKLVVGFAYEFENGWAVGFAPHLNYARFRSDMLTLNFTETKGDNDWDDAWGGGFSLGVYKNWDRISFGATYTSRQWFQTFDDYGDLFFGSMDIPQMFQIGVGYKFTQKLEGVLDYKWIDWNGIRQIGDSPIRGGFGWEDQHIIKAGLTYDINDKWSVRGGLSYGNSPIDDDVVFANGLFPAVTEWHASAGFTHRFSDRHELHLTYMHAFENDLTEKGTSDLFSLVGYNTDISMYQNSVTLEYSFVVQPGRT